MTTWREELAWAAGFFDGEGTFGFTGENKAAYVRINQVDRASLDRFQRAVGVGKVNGPYPHGKWQPLFAYGAYSSERVQAVVAMLWPFLGEVKREQARNVLQNMTRSKPKHRPGESFVGKTCRRNHPQELHRTKYGQCRECMKISDRKRRGS